ncbi:MAG: portal protein [Candidatus Omnitrophota bacterium]
MDKIAKLKEFWKISQNEWNDWVIRAEKAFKFYRGEQWESDVKAELKKQGRPALTFNKIKPIIRNLSGWQRQNRQDQRVLPRKGGSKQLADLFTELLKYFYDASNANWKISQIFMDGLICGKGWLALDVDYEKDPLTGELLLTRENPLLVFEDPYSQRYDLSDAKYIIRCAWYDKDEIIAKFPKVKKEFPAGLATIDTKERQRYSDIEKYRYLVKEIWWREWVEKKLVININTFEVKEVNEPDEKIEALVSQYPFLKAVKRVIPILNLTTMVGDIVLQDIKDPFRGISLFPLVRFVADFVNADKPYVKGEVDDLIDPQMEINKRRSQALHIINTSANSGWEFDEDTFVGLSQERAKLEKMGSTPGITVMKRKGTYLKRITPMPLPDALITLDRLADDDIKKISGVNPDLLGFKEEAGTSGILANLRKQQGLITCEPLFDNFEWTQKILGETLLEFIRKTDILSDEEIANIVDAQRYSIELLKSRKVGKYEVVLTTSPSSPTTRIMNFTMLMELVKMGFPVPPKLLLTYSDIPGKEEMLAELEQQQGGKQPPMSQEAVLPSQSLPIEELPPEIMGVNYEPAT